MATETAERRAAHRRGLKVTALATLGGVAAGIVTGRLAAGATDTIGLAVVLGFVVVELGLMRLVGVDVSDFSTKDNLYVVFMTFSMWFITWAILLTSGTSI